jgi:Transglycosylase SLT domain
MRCFNILFMSAAVAPWVIVPGPAIAAQPAPQTEPSRNVAAQFEALIRKNAGNTEIVSFADPRQHPVKVVRGGKGLPGQTAAAVSGAAPEEPARRPIRGDVEVVSFTNQLERPVTVLRGGPVEAIGADPATAATSPYLDLFAAAGGAELDRVAFAVDGAESSHGTDPGMWHPELGGPQGPMQVSAAAASDSGGGDRFDLRQNRLLGRAYLARLYRRYGNWPDTVAAYNWGPGNMDAWIAQGRPTEGLPLEVERYRDRVLSDGGVAQGAGPALSRTRWQLPTP